MARVLGEILDRIGEPYMTRRRAGAARGGLGLGLFIAKTLLERSGASIFSAMAGARGEGAMSHRAVARETLPCAVEVARSGY